MKWIKSGNTISHMLWKSYLFMIFVSIAMMIVPYFLCIIFSIRINKIEEYHNCSAADIIQDDYRQIDVSRINNLNGSVQVVTGNLEVITLSGEGVLPEKKLSISEWTQFLIQSGAVSNIECDIMYNEKENFWLIVELPIVKIDVKFVVNKDIVEYKQIMKMLWLMFFSYITLVILSVIVYSQMTAKNFRSPFRKLCTYANSLGQGHYEERISLQGPVEFRELVQDLNHLAAELEKERNFRKRAEENRNQLIRDISHDLKNPLMGIRGYAELCLQRNISTQQMKEYLELILHNSIRANELLMSLFEFSKLESADFKLHLETVDLGEFLRQEFITWIPELENKKFDYEVDIPEKEMPAHMDTMQMQRVFSNLFTNAIKYNSEGTAIGLSLKVFQDKYEITFYDNGKGIDQQYMESIFNPFIRPDGKVRNSNDGGSGLGLAIVQRIVILHGGDIWINDNVEKGTKFVIQLPI